MNKKVIKAMYDYIVSKDQIRPNIMGVHFEKERCYATDTHILAIYKCGSEKFDGQTVDANGEKIKGNYPAIDRIIPKKLINPLKVDFRQLRAACSWWAKQSDHNPDDQVVLNGTVLNIRYLSRMLYLFSLTAELGSLTFYLNADASRPVVAVSESLTTLLMPCQLEDESKIDDERIDSELITVSYANLINTYALEICRPKAKKSEPMGWL